MPWQEIACPYCHKPFRIDAAAHPQHAFCLSCAEVVSVPAAAVWYYARDDQKVGPLGFDDLLALTVAGRLAPGDMVWQEGTPRWLPARAVAGLFAPPRPSRARQVIPYALAALLLTVGCALLAALCWRGQTSAADLNSQLKTAAPAGAPVPWAQPESRQAPDPAVSSPADPPAAEPPDPGAPAQAPVSAPTAVLYPAPGQTGIPLAHTGRGEIPGAADKRMSAGYPVTVTFRAGLSVRNARASLTDESCEEVAAWVSTPEQPADPRGQRNTVCLIAREPLRPATVYRVRVRAEVGGEAWARDWKFTTADDGAPEAAVLAKVLARVNDYRALAGLAPVTLDPKLSRGCQAHCAYLARNAEHPSTRGLGAHDEASGLPGFSADGQRAGRASVISWGGVNAESATDGWMATLYHRVPILQPNLKRVGFGQSRRGAGWVVALDVHRGAEPSPAPGVVLYPAPDQVGVPLAFPPGEEPNPIPESRDGRAGYPVTATYPRGTKLRDVALTLKDAAGCDVPAWSSSPEKPANPAFPNHQGSTVCLIAHAPLRPATTYTATGKGEVDGRPWVRTWRFTTRGLRDGSRFAADVLARVNACRRAARLAEVTLDPALSQGCAAHATYLVRNAGHPALRGTGLHREDPARPGYSFAGSAAGRSADIYFGGATPPGHVDNAMGSFFRRVYLLDPGLRRIGFGCAADPGRGWVCIMDLVRGLDPGAASLRAPRQLQLAVAAR
jgi:uncharacterized protein YkwD